MTKQAIAKNAMFVVVLAIIFAGLGYFLYPVLFEILIGSDIEKAASDGLKASTTQDAMAMWFAALGGSIAVGTLMCGVESTKRQKIVYFLFLLIVGLGFAVFWTYFMKDSLSVINNAGVVIFDNVNNVPVTIMEYASFYEIPQFSAVAVLVISLIVFVKKTKDH